MSINFQAALGLHGDALQLRTERSSILAANIANENTPGYQARDMDFASALAGRRQVGGGTADDSSLALYRVPYHPSLDGNTVEIGVEQAAFSQNASDYEASLAFINMTLRGLAKSIAGQ